MSKRNRRYCLTLNNPTEDELRRLAFVETKNLKRAIFGSEVGESGTPHLQGFIHLKNAMTLTAVKKRFGSNRYHVEVAKGTDYEAWTYCAKDGEIFFEFGEEPSIDGELSDWEKIAEMVTQGATNLEIIQRFPSIAIRCQAALDRMRLEHDRATATWRYGSHGPENGLDVYFITGPTGCGKTRHVMEEYGYPNVYRATDKKHPFETYTGQDVLVFEEFRSNYRIEDMLNWLDGYPIELPARYANKIAKYTKVYILTNIQFDELYPKTQNNSPETWDAFKRRFTSIVSLWPN